MINIQEKQKCCGCGACAQVCPAGCIRMFLDEEGFLYPMVLEGDCKKCGLCEKACLYINPYKSIEPKRLLACKNKDSQLRRLSSSGGVFSALAELIIGRNGVVFGAFMDDNHVCRHGYAEALDEYPKFRGSKYIQSIMEDTYISTKKFLENDRFVLFTGCPCQISGLKHFLGKDYRKLFCVDFICHGVPSHEVLKQYLQSIEETNGAKITKIRFRTKAAGWKKFPLTVAFKNQDMKLIEPDDYIQGFSQNLFLRPSCYACVVNHFRSGSDLTMADYWGVKTIFPEFDDEQGISLVLVNTERGETLFKDIEIDMETIQSTLEHAEIFQMHLKQSAKKNKYRDSFFDALNHGEDFSVLAKKYIRSSYIYQLKRILKPDDVRRIQFFLAKIRKLVKTR